MKKVRELAMQVSGGRGASAETLSRDAVCGLEKHEEARVRESGRR